MTKEPGATIDDDDKILRLAGVASDTGYSSTLPHAILGFVATWLWWPKSQEARHKFGFVAAYLLVFSLVMRYVFGANGQFSDDTQNYW